MTVLLWLSLIASGFGFRPVGDPSALNAGKIDPVLILQVRHLLSEQRGDEIVHVLIRLRGEATTVQRGAIEQKGGKIETALGDVLTVRVPAASVFEISDLDFITYIETAKKQRPQNGPDSPGGDPSAVLERMGHPFGTTRRE